jgi:hypothetical protein
LIAATLARDAPDKFIRNAGLMRIAMLGGEVLTGDPIRIELPGGPAPASRPVQPEPCIAAPSFCQK